MVKIAINGLGRIGRCILRALAEYNYDDIELVSVNGPAKLEDHIHLIKYDSIHGKFKGTIDKYESGFIINGKKIQVYHERDISKLDWSGIDIVLECTGKFNKREEAAKHIEMGAKKVIVSAPCDGADATIIYKVNDDLLDYSKHNVISIGSCTTNCLAPVAKVLNDKIGIDSGFMTTIHSYTNDQNILDGSHKDLRRARAAGVSMVPTSTGAAKSIGIVIPELKGKLDGSAIRVPTPNVSVIDFKFIANRNTNIEEVNRYIKEAADSYMKGVLSYTDEPLVSCDFIHDTNSSIVDLSETKVVSGNLVRVLSWYDNEWGFSLRMLDIARSFYKKYT